MNNLPPIPPDQIGENKPWRTWFTSLRQNIAQTYLKPINNTNSTTDLSLGVGQSAYLTFTSAISMPLHIACGDGQIYEIEMAGSYTLPASAAAKSILQPNNTTPATNSFSIRELYQTGSTANGTSGAVTDGGFRLEAYGTSVLEGSYKFFTSTANKKALVRGASSTATTGYFLDGAIEWLDTTTVWSSLGTVIMPNAWTGTVVVRRIA